ncbi:MAG TPA: tetrahydromethanopterin S-methyltransferase subunit A [Candidatus Bathyarchaeia archaeon]|nr:tetrahydromethanopterin S-methyltransferase subunit A [Candidatus Bathyarchaeia archaeon]
MAEKVAPAANWPVTKGDFFFGDPESPVAVVTLGSHFGKVFTDIGAAIEGTAKTENIGLEKVIVNIISNPNIRFLILCGSEIMGHVTGQSLEALYHNGVKEGRIVDAKGAIPFIENLSEEHLERFQKQVEFISIIGNEDVSAITAKVKELIGRDPGAYPEPPVVVEIKEKEAEEAIVEAPMAAELAALQSRVQHLQFHMKTIGNYNKYAAGVYAGKIEGIVIGLLISIGILGLLALA